VQGVFVASGDFSRYTKNTVLAATGKETPVFVRFSTVMPFRGSPEAARDPRGFAVKFYSDQGNWDIVGINQPVFFIRDAIKFPDFVHALKPSPVTNIQDPNRAFDFFANVPDRPTCSPACTLISMASPPAIARWTAMVSTPSAWSMRRVSRFSPSSTGRAIRASRA
jgi:catalase